MLLNILHNVLNDGCVVSWMLQVKINSIRLINPELRTEVLK